MAFDILAYGLRSSVDEYFKAKSAPEGELPELPQEQRLRPVPGLPMSVEQRRRKLLLRELAMQSEVAEASTLGAIVEQVLGDYAPQYRLTRIVKRNGSGWHLMMEYAPNGSAEGFRDVHLDEEILGGSDTDRGRLLRIDKSHLHGAILSALRQQEPMRSAG